VENADIYLQNTNATNVDLKGHRGIIMGKAPAKVIVTMKVLPNSPEVDLHRLGDNVEHKIVKYGKMYKRSMQPIAFGINALVFAFMMEETAGGTDPVENDVKTVEGVGDVEVTDVTRMMDVRDL